MRLALLTLFLALFSTSAEAGRVNPLLRDSVFMTKLVATFPSYSEYDLNTKTFPYAVVNGQVSMDGYPVYAMTCDFLYQLDCYGEDGQYLGSLHHVASKMTPVSTSDTNRIGWFCNFICIDADENVVGAFRPDVP